MADENITVIVRPPEVSVAVKVSSGTAGPPGPTMLASGLEADKVNYNTALNGFVYLTTDTQVFYVKDSEQLGGWLGPYAMGGGSGTVSEEQLRRHFLY